MPPKASAVSTGQTPEHEMLESALKTNLLYLNESMVKLQEMLMQPGGAMPDWPSLVALYSSLLSQAQGIAVQLGKPPDVEQTQRELQRHLARVVPHPVRPIDYARDAELVGLVLNTAAPSMAEETERRAIVDTLPEHLRLKKTDDAEEAAREAVPVLERVQAAIAQHDRLASFARRRVALISGLEQGDSDDEDDDDEMFRADSLPEYDWKMRLPIKGALSTSQQQSTLLQDCASVIRDGR